MTIDVLTWGLFTIIGLLVLLGYKTIRQFWAYEDKIDQLTTDVDCLQIELKSYEITDRRLFAALAENRTLKETLAYWQKKQ